MYKKANQIWVRHTTGPSLAKPNRPGKGWAHKTRPKGPKPTKPANDAPYEQWKKFASECQKSGWVLGPLPQNIRRQLISDAVI